MKTIAELLSRDLTRRIEEIIQVDQSDDQSVFAEITEYIATDSIRDQYRTLLKAIAIAMTMVLAEPVAILQHRPAATAAQAGRQESRCPRARRRAPP